VQYMGGKATIAKELAAAMLSITPNRERYLEPFVGGAWVLAQMAPQFGESSAGDLMPDVVMLWQAVQSGWTPPSVMTRAEWDQLRFESPSALRAFAGFGCSFGGRFFRGYARHDPRPGRSPAATASANEIERKREPLANTTFRTVDYASWDVVPGTVVYCDPPYPSTEPYAQMPVWDAARFWGTAGSWADSGATVFVSSYLAPSAAWQCVWHKEKRVTLNRHANGSHAIERLFMRDGAR
jgi:DNA adenine methylase